MVGVVVSTLVIGPVLAGMNIAFESFQKLPAPKAMSLQALPDGVTNQGQFTRDNLTVVPYGSKANASGETMSNGRQYVLLNSIGSGTLEDGKYLYNRTTGQIDIQWVQGIGSETVAAPQGRLMATVINGILSRKLPWSLVLLGVMLVLVVEMLGIRSLTFAVGAYLSIGTTLAIFCGGVIRWLIDQAAARAGTQHEGASEEVSPGSLYASGLIAAGGIMGLLGVGVKVYEGHWDKKIWRFSDGNPLHHDWVSVLAFAALAYSLYHFARKPLAGEQVLEQVERGE